MASPRIDYKAGVLTSGTVLLTGLVRSLSVFAAGADATFTLQAADPPLSAETITVRSGAGKDLNFFDSMRNVTVTWLSGTLDYLAWVTP